MTVLDTLLSAERTVDKVGQFETYVETLCGFSFRYVYSSIPALRPWNVATATFYLGKLARMRYLRSDFRGHDLEESKEEAPYCTPMGADIDKRGR